MSRLESERAVDKVKMNSTRAETVVDLTLRDPTKIVQVARSRFNEGRTLPIKFRRKQLNGLVRLVEENEQAIVDAIHRDLRKPEQEAVSYEVLPTLNEIKHVLNHLDEWTRPGEAPQAADQSHGWGLRLQGPLRGGARHGGLELPFPSHAGAPHRSVFELGRFKVAPECNMQKALTCVSPTPSV
jgi:hypothetical protein